MIKPHHHIMIIVKYSIVLLATMFASGCTLLYSGDGEYIVDRYYLFVSYSIEFPYVPIDREGVYEYHFDNYYTANSAKGLEFEVKGDDPIVPTLLSTNITFAVYDSRNELVAYMSSPLNKRELIFFEEQHSYPDMSWMGQCSTYYNGLDDDARRLIAQNPNNKKLINDYVSRFRISECRFGPDYDVSSPYRDNFDGGRIKSFHKYHVVLTISKPNTALKNIYGRLVLRSGWK